MASFVLIESPTRRILELENVGRILLEDDRVPTIITSFDREDGKGRRRRRPRITYRKPEPRTLTLDLDVYAGLKYPTKHVKIGSFGTLSYQIDVETGVTGKIWYKTMSETLPLYETNYTVGCPINFGGNLFYTTKSLVEATGRKDYTRIKEGLKLLLLNI